MKLIRPMPINDAALVSSSVPETDYSAYSAATVYAQGDRAIYVAADTHKVYESLRGTRSTATMTIASPCVVTWPGTLPAADTPIQFSTTGALPTGLTPGTVYYVKSPSAGTFNLAASAGGAAINTSGSQSGVHTGVASLNYAKPLASSADDWIEVGATNRWRMFDDSVTATTSAATSIAVVLQQSERINSVALFNLDAATVHIGITDPTDGLVYSEDFDLVSDSGILDWYAYFFEPIVRKTELVVTDLPVYGTAQMAISINAPGGVAACGECVVGLYRDIGLARYGAELGIQDYSVKAVDDFGNFSITERAFANRATFSVWMESSTTREVKRLLETYRATPIVYVGIDGRDETIVYGFYRDFRISLPNPPVSLCDIELVGLT